MLTPPALPTTCSKIVCKKQRNLALCTHAPLALSVLQSITVYFLKGNLFSHHLYILDPTSGGVITINFCWWLYLLSDPMGFPFSVKRANGIWWAHNYYPLDFVLLHAQLKVLRVWTNWLVLSFMKISCSSWRIYQFISFLS